MKLIFAQGNIGGRYANTRHNIGWYIIDAVAEHLSTSFVAKDKFQAMVAETTVDGQKILLAKPTTYYNLTGQSARQIADFYKLAASDILVIHDDLALPIGTLRIRNKGSDAGNNGIKSLNAHLGPDYTRLRVGIASAHQASQDSTNFVLSPLSKAEQTILDEMLPKIIDTIDDFIAGQLSLTTYTHPTD